MKHDLEFDVCARMPSDSKTSRNLNRDFSKINACKLLHSKRHEYCLERTTGDRSIFRRMNLHADGLLYDDLNYSAGITLP